MRRPSGASPPRPSFPSLRQRSRDFSPKVLVPADSGVLNMFGMFRELHISIQQIHYSVESGRSGRPTSLGYCVKTNNVVLQHRNPHPARSVSTRGRRTVRACLGHRVLGEQQFWICFDLASVFAREGRLDGASRQFPTRPSHKPPSTQLVLYGLAAFRSVSPAIPLPVRRPSDLRHRLPMPPILPGPLS